MTALRARALATPPWLFALVPGLAWLAFAPATPDLAAAEYRVELYSHIHVRLWDNFWYSGHHLPAYSVLYPPLASHIGDRWLGVICAVLSATLFDLVARAYFGDRARTGVRLFAVGTVAALCIGQLTFSLGICAALAALLAWQRLHPSVAVALAAVSGLASPVAAAFLALAACAVFAGRDARRDRTAITAVLVAGAALLTVIFLALAFPEGGRQPFELQSLVPVLAASLVLVLAFGSTERVLRIGAVFYALASLASYVLSTPMGSNANRLGAAFAPALVACAPVRRRSLLVVACLVLLAWQWTGPVRDIRLGARDPSRHASFYAPLLDFLDGQTAPSGRDALPARVEIPFTRLHWESRYVAQDYPLARGWERQLDTKYDGLFYANDKHVDSGEYHAWLRANAVRWVAVPNADLDPAGEHEAALIRTGLPYLRLVWRRGDWTIYELRDPLPLAAEPLQVTDMGHNHIDGYASRAGWSVLRVHYSSYFETRGAVTCVKRGPGTWTSLYAGGKGQFSLRAKFSVAGLLQRDSNCHK